MAFERVATEAVLDGCYRKENAWNIISDYSLYPTIMENVDRVEITERNGDEGVSRWDITIEEAPLYWIEKDYFNRRSYEILFKSIEGDFDNINGRWTINDNIESGIHLRFEIQYNLGIPVIEEVLGHILKEKMKTNIEKMVAAVRKELCAKAADERRQTRHAIGSSFPLLLNDTPLRLRLLNLSAGGMMTRYHPDLPKNGRVVLADTVLDIDAIYQNEALDRCHFIFSHPLPEELFKPLLGRLTHGRGRLLPSSAPQEALVFFDEQELPATVLELAKDRMSIRLQGAVVPHLETFAIGNSAIQINEIVCDQGSKTVDLRFSNGLSDEQYQWMRDRFSIGVAQA